MLRSVFAATRRSTVSLLGTILLAAAAHAQAAVSGGPAGCEEAGARVNGTSLPRVGAPQWNDWMTLTGCGSRGATIIAGALKSDAIRSESELSRLDHLAGILDGWFQPQLVNAYEFVLRAPDASNAMKLRSMWLLTGLYAPGVDVAGPLQGYMSARCETYERTTTLREAPERLPESAYGEARAAIAHVADDRMSPEYVRSTARCWDGVIRDELSRSSIVEDDAPEVVHASSRTVVVHRPVRVVYDCDNRFVFYNDAGYDLAVRYSGYSTGILRVSHGGPFVWAAARFGPVRFWMGDTEIFYETAVYRSCRTHGHRVIVGGPIYPWLGWHTGLGVYINVNVPIVRPRVRYVVRPVYPSHRTIFYPRVTRPIIVGPGRRDIDDWNRRRDNDDWNRRRDDSDWNRRRDDDNRGRTYGYNGTPPRTAEPRQRNDGRTYGYNGTPPRAPEPRRPNDGRTYGDYGPRPATPAQQPQRVFSVPFEQPRGRPEMPRFAVPKGGTEGVLEPRRVGNEESDRGDRGDRGGPRRKG
jgi:hypothetical protein